jgi:hypothetical protein
MVQNLVESMLIGLHGGLDRVWCEDGAAGKVDKPLPVKPRIVHRARIAVMHNGLVKVLKLLLGPIPVASSGINDQSGWWDRY